MLPDRSILVGQKLIENAKIEMAKTRQIDHLWHFLMNLNVARNVEWDILGDFQTLWTLEMLNATFSVILAIFGIFRIAV